MVEIRVKKTKCGFFITAHLDGKQVGEITLFQLKDDHYRVSMIFVSEKHQKKGIGTKLMETAFGLCGSIDLECINEVCPFYEKLGFKVHEKGLICELVWKNPNFKSE